MKQPHEAPKLTMSTFIPCCRVIPFYNRPVHGASLDNLSSSTCYPLQKSRRYLRKTPQSNPSHITPQASLSPNSSDTASGEQVQDPQQTTLSDTERTELWENVAQLQASLKVAVRGERYGDAARLRDEIESLSRKDPYWKAERELEAAVEGERYGEAARLRDLLKGMTPPPKKGRRKGVGVGKGKGKDGGDDGKWVDGLNEGDVNVVSEATTQGIKVRVESRFLDEQSSKDLGRWIFGYRINISNESRRTVQLVSRYWKIVSAKGEVHEVRGSGVVGKQPVLAPGEKYEYESVCPISVPANMAKEAVLGFMQGKYTMVTGAVGNQKFEVDIARFYLVVPS